MARKFCIIHTNAVISIICNDLTSLESQFAVLSVVANRRITCKFYAEDGSAFVQNGRGIN